MSRLIRCAVLFILVLMSTLVFASPTPNTELSSPAFLSNLTRRGGDGEKIQLTPTQEKIIVELGSLEEYFVKMDGPDKATVQDPVEYNKKHQRYLDLVSELQQSFGTKMYEPPSESFLCIKDDRHQHQRIERAARWAPFWNRKDIILNEQYRRLLEGSKCDIFALMRLKIRDGPNPLLKGDHTDEIDEVMMQLNTYLYQGFEAKAEKECINTPLAYIWKPQRRSFLQWLASTFPARLLIKIYKKLFGDRRQI